MKKTVYTFLVLSFLSTNLFAQEHINELGVSLFSLETYKPGHFDFGIGGYINPLNSIVYKRALNEDLKLRGILIAEINASNLPDYRDDCNDCESFTHTANAIGLSAGAQFGRTYNKFSPYGYADLFYRYKDESAEYFNPWSFSSGQYSKNINSFGMRIGFGLEYNFTDRLSVTLEPYLSVAQEITNGEGNRNYVKLNWDNSKETTVSLRGVNILSLNVKF